MARSSPCVSRVAAILNFIADHPGQSFVLTDLVRALKLSRATCHALLIGLVEVGYLYRASDKSYVLGPALAAIGRSVAEHFSPLQVAQPEMRTLADEYDVVCSAIVLEGDSAVVRERAASASHVGYAAALGTRVKLRPQSAATFFAWASPEQAEAWLDSLTPPPTDEQRAALFKSMEIARKLGFVLVVRKSGVPDEQSRDLSFGESIEQTVAVASEVQAGEAYSVLSILAPVFDHRGKIAFALSLSGFQQAMDGSAVLSLAERLRDTCDRMSDFIVGRRPAETALG